MTMGEIGCFLSHYNIWNKVIIKFKKLIILIKLNLYIIYIM